MKRLFDILVCASLLIGLSPLILAIWLIVKLSSSGPALYWSDRIGQYNAIFCMPKFRTMIVGTPARATHELGDPQNWLTPVGSVLRATSLDELPQLWSILTGKMSFVGPRPALFNQHDLIALRTAANVHSLVPGLTGWAQINGRDDLTIAEKVKYDEEYLYRISILFDIKILFITMNSVIFGHGISH